MKKKLLSCLLIFLLLSGCSQSNETVMNTIDNKTIEVSGYSTAIDRTDISEDITINNSVVELLKKMTIAEKASQMVQAELHAITLEEITQYGIGSILSGGGSTPPENTLEGWKEATESIVDASLQTRLQIPVLYGYDAVHGNGNLYNATIFPHNIGLGAGNDIALVEKMGEIVGREMLAAGVAWNFGPCVALAEDPRWGRTYESFSTNPDTTSQLAVAYLKGISRSGALATAKHYLGDGNTVYGTGLNSGNDRGDTQMSETELKETVLRPYKALVEAGVPTVMVSFSSINGVKMHQDKYWITDVLKQELGFKGIVISDWEGIHELEGSLEEQVWASITAGMDMLMEPYAWRDVIEAIINGVENGELSMERIDDAVARILKVKMEMGLFEDPKLSAYTDGMALRKSESLQIASDLAASSVVLLKNEQALLPIQPGKKVYVLGQGANDIGIQCGGWTMTWQGFADDGQKITEGTTLLEGLQAIASEKNIEIITREDQADRADMTLLVLSEIPYAEYEGDTSDLSLTGRLAHRDNEELIAEATALGKPIVTVLIGGRQADIAPYLGQWQAFAMAYLPGTEGQGVAQVLLGEKPFVGKLPMPWYTVKIDANGDNSLEEIYEIGYGLDQ